MEFPETTRHTPVKVYADASKVFRPNGDIVGVGFVFTTHTGRHINYYYENANNSLGTVAAEIEAVERAVSYARRRDVDHLKVLTDAEQAVEKISLQAIGRGFENVTIEHIPREQNRLADRMATFASRHSTGRSRAKYGYTD